MRKRHNANYTVKSFMKMIENEELTFDYPVQRPKGQWNELQKSLLIHSVLTDYDIPSIYAVEDKTTDKSTYSIIDGVQRLNNLFEYVTGRFELHKDTPPAIIDGRAYDIAKHEFSELPEILREVIDTYQLNMIYFININDDEIFEMFFRLNNGTPLSSQQKAKSKMGLDSAILIRNLTMNDFIKSKVKLTVNQRKKNDEELIIEQAMMLMDDSYTISKFNVKDASEYMETLSEKDDEFLNKVKDTVMYLNSVYDNLEGGTELRKVNVPMLIAVASKAEGTVEPHKFYEWTRKLDEFISNPESEYTQYIGDATTNKGKVDGRYNTMLKFYNEHFNLVKASAV